MTAVTAGRAAILQACRAVTTIMPMSPQRPTPLDWALFFFIVASWGSAYAAVHFALQYGATPWMIVAGRFWIGAILLNVILWIRRARGREPPETRGVRTKLILMGVLGGALPFALFSFAQLGAPSGLVGLYSAVAPLIVAVGAPFLARDDRMNLGRLFGVLLGFCGVAALMAPSALEGVGSASMLAQIAAALGAICYAGNTLLARQGAAIPALEAAARWTFFGALFSTPFALMTLPDPGSVEWPAFAAIGFLAIFATALGTIAYFYLIGKNDIVFVTQTNYLQPLWALALGAIIFSEPVGLNAVLGFVLIVGGVFVAQEGWRALGHSQRPAEKRRSSP